MTGFSSDYPPRPSLSDGAGAASYSTGSSSADSYGAGFSSADSSGAGSSGADSSRTEAAKSAAADVAGGAKDAAATVAQTASEQARDVAAQTKAQARDLLGEGRSQLQEQARRTQSSAASSLGALADELRQMAQGSQQSGTASELVRQASERAQGLAGWLRDREPGDALEEVRSFARSRPGVFILGAALAGVAAGRLTRGAVAAAHDESTSTSTSTAVASPSLPPVGIRDDAQASYPPPLATGFGESAAPAPGLVGDEWAVAGQTSSPAGSSL